MYKLTDKQLKNFCKKIIVDEKGVFRWNGAKNDSGYGYFNLNGRATRAHRIAYALWGDEELTPELHVLHKDDCPDCVDPRLLFLGTHTDNVRDMNTKGRGNQVFGERHCHAKVTEAEAFGIYQRAWRGENQNSIANDYGVTKSTVSHIKTRRTWKHIHRGGAIVEARD